MGEGGGGMGGCRSIHYIKLSLFYLSVLIRYGMNLTGNLIEICTTYFGSAWGETDQGKSTLGRMLDQRVIQTSDPAQIG